MGTSTTHVVRAHNRLKNGVGSLVFFSNIWCSANSSSSIPKSTKQSQVPASFSTSPNGDIKMMFPIMCPAFVPGLIPMQNQEKQTNLGASLYVVPTFPFMPPMSGIPSNTLIPLNYTVPTRRTTAEGGAITDEHG
ncbi:hypothetical protein IFM89_013038 [Coptis chinensis]|uniref:Uncharacterized protein n=1 Tax=Coptis chinensis TaxID=261450 RepID=A0A835GX72_9MAGN|nr:hypothetical protein IFM89_013038 [Coptis chinensis]